MVPSGRNATPRIESRWPSRDDRRSPDGTFQSSTVLPRRPHARIALSGEKYQRVYQSKDPIAAAIITNYRLWATARGMGSPEGVPTHSTTLFDTVAVYLAFSQEWCNMETLGIRVTDDGLTVEDPNAKKMDVAIKWKNLVAFEDLLVQRLTQTP